jgi:hypothetical protein
MPAIENVHLSWAEKIGKVQILLVQNTNLKLWQSNLSTCMLLVSDLLLPEKPSGRPKNQKLDHIKFVVAHGAVSK